MWIAHLIVLALGLLNSIKYVTSNRTMEGFVVGGDYAEIMHFPHSAYLAVSCYSSTGTENWACGSSIINQRILLTAAHCLEDCLQSSFVGIRVGSAHKDKGLTHKASKFVLHPQYHSRLIRNDLAVIHVSTPLKFGMNVKRIVLMKNPPYTEPAAVAGWGLTDERYKVGTFLLKAAKQKVWKRTDCEILLYKMPKNTFCADKGYPGKKKVGYAATGDSGSALVVRGYIQIGLVSYKNPSISRSLVVYTDVAQYIKWIKKISRELYCQYQHG